MKLSMQGFFRKKNSVTGSCGRLYVWKTFVQPKLNYLEMKWETLNHSVRRKLSKPPMRFCYFPDEMPGEKCPRWLGMQRADEDREWHRSKVQWIQHQPARVQFAFYLCPSDSFQRRRQRTFIHAEDARDCLHSWRLIRFMGRIGIVSKDFSYAQAPGANQ